MQRVIVLLVFALVTLALAGSPVYIPLTASKLDDSEVQYSAFVSTLGEIAQPKFKNEGMMIYTTQASIGTPAQTLTISFDLTFSDALIAASDCTTSSCRGRQLFNMKKSSTFKRNNNFQSNQSVVGTDTVRIGGATLRGYTFAVTSTFELPSKDNPSSGVFGLAGSAYAILGAPNLLTAMINAGAINQSIFSIYLNPKQGSTDSFVLFGGTDSTKYSGHIHYRPVTSNRFWAVRLVSITLDGDRVHYCNNPCRAVFSTLDPYIYGPPVEVRKINNALNISKDCSNYYTLPRLVFHLGPHYLSIPRSSYVNRVNNQCESLLFEAPLLRQNFVLGNLFLRSYYTVFDATAGQPRIGWAALMPTVMTN